jgi:hypothetical protein
MIDVNEYEKNDELWLVVQEIEKMLEPKKVKYVSRESANGKKLAFILLNGKRVCVPTNLLFKSKVDAEIFSSINLIKLYYSFDPFTISEGVDEETLLEAHRRMEYYEEEEPAKFLYYWMGNVPNR